MNIKSKTFAICVLAFSLLLVGCGPGQLLEATVTPTPTLTNTPTPTNTSTPSPTATQTLIPTPTPLKYPRVYDIADYAQNPLSVEDMKPGGKVDQFLAEIKPELMASIDWDSIKDDIPFSTTAGAMVYRSIENTGVKFLNPDLDPSVPDTNPFDRNIGAFGLYTADNGRKYIFIPLEIRDINAPTESGHDLYFIKLLLPLQHNDGTPFSKEEIEYEINTWKNQMNIAPIGLNSEPNISDPRGTKDPTFARLDSAEWKDDTFDRIISQIVVGREPVHGDLSLLKELQSWLLPTQSNYTEGNRYK